MIPASIPFMNTSSLNDQVKAGYETTDAHPGVIWIVAGGLVASIVIVILGITWMHHSLQRRALAAQRASEMDRVTKAVAATRPLYPEPRLQVAPEKDLAALRAREDAELNTYGWVNRKAGVVRIPITRAMDLLVQRGLPVRGQPNAPKPRFTPLDMQQARPLQIQPTEPPK
jgi:hypothetical protein